MVSLLSINREAPSRGGDLCLQLESDAAPDTAEALVIPRPFPAETGIGSADQLSALTAFISPSRKAAAFSTALAPNSGDPGWAPALHFPRLHLFGFQGRSSPRSSKKKDQNKEASFIINKIYPIFIKCTPTLALVMEKGCFWS